MTEGLAPRGEGNVLWLGCLLIFPRSVSTISPGGRRLMARRTSPVRGGELLAASWFAQAFCVTFFSVHFRLLYWHRLPLAGSGPFPQTFFHSVFFYGSCFALLLDLLLVASSVLGWEAACGRERLDRMDTSRLPPLVHAIASVHFVCIYDVIVIYVVFFRETGHAELV